MRVLILGGTIFAGRHIAQALLERDHEPVLFHRGRSGADLFPDVERVLGDRETDLARLGERRFDAVVDPSGYVPHVVRASAEFLAPRASRYLFISSINAYESTDRSIEGSPLAQLPDGASDAVYDEQHYGPLKALCEGAAREAFGPERTIVIRPGLIVGPYDPTDRYSYWPARMARGGEVLAPNSPDDPVQFIDARDLAAWIVTLLEAQAHGEFNAVSPRDAFTLGDVLEACRAAAANDARLTWVENAFLEAQGVGPWMELPLWIPPSLGIPGFFDIDVTRALASGLRVRAPLETARDTLAWLRTRPADHVWAAGMKPEREAELLALFRRRDPLYSSLRPQE
jgi:2'-hydroxyisoflavone reductase